MDISDSDGLWRITCLGRNPCQIENRRTKEVRVLDRKPSAGRISSMSYDTFLRKCGEAFASGVWPKTRWSSGDVTD